MLLEGDDGISMMQFGEGQGVVLPSGELLVCGWFKLKGRPPGELDKTDSIACLSSTVRTRFFAGHKEVPGFEETDRAQDSGESWSIKGRLPAPLPKPFNEVTMGLMKNNSLWLSMRADPKVPLRYQARSDDGGRTYTSEPPPFPARCED